MAAPSWRRLETAALTEASGVRRSCETAPIMAPRQRSISSRRRVAQGLVLQLCPLDGQSRLVGEGAEQGAVLPGELHLLEDEQPDGAVARHERYGDPARRPRPGHAQRPDLPAARRERGQLVGRELLAGRGPPRRGRAPRRPRDRRRPGGAAPSSAVRRRFAPWWRCDRGARRCSMSPISAWESSNSRPASCSRRRASSRAESRLGDDLGHDEHHDEIDDQGQPVAAGVDRQGAVRGKEENVVEARSRPPRPQRRPQKPPTTTPMMTGMTKTRAGVAMLRWERNGSSTANRAPCADQGASGRRGEHRRYVPLRACMRRIAFGHNFPGKVPPGPSVPRTLPDHPELAGGADRPGRPPVDDRP